MKYMTHRSKVLCFFKRISVLNFQFTFIFLNICLSEIFNTQYFNFSTLSKVFPNPLPWNEPKEIKKELVRLKMVDFHFRLSDLTSDQSVFLLRTRIGILRCKSVWPIWHWFYYYRGANNFAPKCTRLLYHCHIRTTNLVTYMWYQNNIWNILRFLNIELLSRLRCFYGNFDIFWNSYVIQRSIFGIQRCLQKFAT